MITSYTAVMMSCPVFTQLNHTKPTDDIVGWQSVIIRLESIMNDAIKSVALPRNMIDVAIFDVTSADLPDLRASNRSLLYEGMSPSLANAMFHENKASYDIVVDFLTHGREYKVYIYIIIIDGIHMIIVTTVETTITPPVIP
jgi:hypothetical protein